MHSRETETEKLAGVDTTNQKQPFQRDSFLIAISMILIVQSKLKSFDEMVEEKRQERLQQRRLKRIKDRKLQKKLEREEAIRREAEEKERQGILCSLHYH